MSCWTKVDGLYRIDIARLAGHLASRGLAVTIIDGAQGRAAVDTAGRRGFPTVPGTFVAHHTATPNSYAGDYPTLRGVRDGTQGFHAPMAQLGLGRSGRVYLIASGLAWHAGVVNNRAYDNWHAVGCEAEDNGTDNYFPPVQYKAYTKLAAACAEPAGLGLSVIRGHKEIASPPGRKVDPVFSMSQFRTDVDAVRRSWGTKPPTPPTPPVPGSNEVLKYGDRGAAVLNLQKGLNRVFPSYSKLSLDSSFGPAVKKVVQEFQRRSKLEVDGIVGPKTRAELAKYHIAF